MKELFIVFEGIDGSGTSTQANLLKEYFMSRGSQAIISPEPTNGPIGKLLRELLRHNNILIEPTKFEEQMAYLFAADRHYHLYNEVDGVFHLIAQQINVISTRYYFSSLAYNCHNPEEFNFVSCLNKRFPNPDLVVYVDVPIEVAISRLKGRPYREIYEHGQKLAQVRQNYRDIFDNYQGLLLKLDGNESKTSLHSQIVDFITKQF